MIQTQNIRPNNTNRKPQRKVIKLISNQNSRLSWVSGFEQPDPGAPLLDLRLSMVISENKLSQF